MSAVSLSQVKAFLNITSSTNGGELVAMIDRAEAVLSRRVGPLTPVTVTNEVHTATGPIVLRQRPVISVTSVTSAGYAVTDTEVDAEAGVLHGTFYDTYRGTLVSYVAGRLSPLPADLEAAVLELVGHLWTSQRGSSPSPLALQDGEGDATTGGSFLLPYRVQSLIEPHILPTLA